MLSDKTGFFFEPVKIVVGQRFEASLEHGETEEFITAPRAELGGQYFFSKAIAENKDEFETLDVGLDFSNLIKSAYETVSSKLEEMLSPIVSSGMVKILFRFPREAPDYLIRRALQETPKSLYFHKKSSSVIIQNSPHVFCVLSNEPKNVNALVDTIKSKFGELSNVTKDFGLELIKFQTSKDYQKSILENFPNVKSVKYGKPRNDLERDVINLCSKVTSSFVSNVKVDFEAPTESFEYDVFMGFPMKIKIIIEPTDYKTLRKEIRNQTIAPDTLKSKIILAVQDKAQRFGAKSIVIVNGFPENSFQQLKTLADSRGVELMNESDYKEKLPTSLCETVLSIFSQRRTTFTRFRE